jgi:hypothetical protein
MNRPRPYSVPSGSETPEEPSSGIYWTHDDSDGRPVFHGPYRDKWDANQAITEWMREQVAIGCGCRQSECESKQHGCRMAREADTRAPEAM